MDLFSAFTTLVRVVDSGSFSAASRVMGTSQATISRQIALLEDHFGTRLFHRTTRQLTLTDDGQSLLDHARRVSDEIVAAEASIGRQRAAPQGRVHLATPMAFGLFLARQLPRLHEQHPGISLNLLLQDTTPNLIESGLDLAIRIGTAQEGPVISRQIGTVRRVVVAAPAFLQTIDPPQTLADLTKYNCIDYHYGTVDSGWDFEGPKGPEHLQVAGWLSTSNSVAARQAVLAGIGIAVLPMFLVGPDLESGALVRLLPNHRMPTVPAHIAYPSRQNMPPKTRVVIDFVVDLFTSAVGNT